jgi:biopolymer transport protein ExbD
MTRKRFFTALAGVLAAPIALFAAKATRPATHAPEQTIKVTIDSSESFSFNASERMVHMVKQHVKDELNRQARHGGLRTHHIIT